MKHNTAQKTGLLLLTLGISTACGDLSGQEAAAARQPDGAPTAVQPPTVGSTPGSVSNSNSTTSAANPNNPNASGQPPVVSSAGDGNFVIGPKYTPAPEETVNKSVPQGTVSEFTMASSASAIYKGTDPYLTKKAPFTRDVWVYVPKQYDGKSPAPFIVVQDGGAYLTRTVTALDNLIAENKIPVMIGIFINSGGGDGPGSERGLEYDTVSDLYVTFVETEVLPLVEKNYKVVLTTDAAGRATMGGSSGGAAAFTMAWFRPDLYSRVLTYSGTFVDQHPTAAYPVGAYGYPQSLVAQAATKPIRVFLEVGQNDHTSTDPEKDWISANEKMSHLLEAKGYHSRFLYALDAVHIDPNVIAQTLPGSLEWLWQGYVAP